MARSRAQLSTSPLAGFTLVEILVAISVLMMLFMLVTQLTKSVSDTTIAGRQRLDADSQARMIFDRMANDFCQMVKRKDVDYIFYKNRANSPVTNDTMFFYSRAPAFFSGTASRCPISLVGYRANPSTLQLERLSEALTWDNTTSNDASSTSSNSTPGGVVFLTYAGPTPVPASTLSGNWVKTIGTAAGNYVNGNDLNYHVIGSDAFRFEIAFLLTDGRTSTKPILSTSPANWPASATFYTAATSDPPATSEGTSYIQGSRWFNSNTNQGYLCTNATPNGIGTDLVWIRIGIQDISAIIVTIAILDHSSRKLVTNSAHMVSALADPSDTDLQSTPPKLMAQIWLNAIKEPTFHQTAGIPSAAASQVRVFQRYFYLNNE